MEDGGGRGGRGEKGRRVEEERMREEGERRQERSHTLLGQVLSIVGMLLCIQGPHGVV
jgi:hypothetical protein